MTKPSLFSENQARKSLILIFLAVFVIVNWGSTIAALEHVVLTARTYRIETLNKKMIAGIGSTIIPFGETIAHLVSSVVIYSFMDWGIRNLDLDKKRFKDETNYLLKENTYLRKDIQLSKLEITNLLDLTDNLPARMVVLEKYHDRIAELTIELETLFQKNERAKKGRVKDKKADSLDLFDGSKLKPKSKVKNRRPSRPVKP